MKHPLICSALFTLLSIQVHSEGAPAIPQPNASQSSSSQVVPPIPGSPPASNPEINCDYKIPAQTKKIEQTLILDWSQKAVLQAFTFESNSLDTQMQKLQACFTEPGWKGFNNALQKSGNLNAIKSQKLTVSSRINGAVLINETQENQWKLTVPITVVYQSEQEKVSQLLSVDLTVARKPNGDLGISQMIAAPRGSVTTKIPIPEPSNPENTNLETRPH